MIITEQITLIVNIISIAVILGVTFGSLLMFFGRN